MALKAMEAAKCSQAGTDVLALYVLLLGIWTRAGSAGSAATGSAAKRPPQEAGPAPGGLAPPAKRRRVSERCEKRERETPTEKKAMEGTNCMRCRSDEAEEFCRSDTHTAHANPAASDTVEALACVWCRDWQTYQFCEACGMGYCEQCAFVFLKDCTSCGLSPLCHSCPCLCEVRPVETRLSARNTFGSSHQNVFLRDPDELMKRFPWLRKSLAEGLQWQIIHPSSSACTWSIAAALARACGTQDVHEFEAMLEMLDFLDKVASLKFGDTADSAVSDTTS